MKKKFEEMRYIEIRYIGWDEIYRMIYRNEKN